MKAETVYLALTSLGLIAIVYGLSQQANAILVCGSLTVLGATMFGLALRRKG